MPRRQPPGQLLGDVTLGGDQHGGDEPFDDGRPRRDDPAATKLVHQGCGYARDIRGGQGDGQQPGRELAGLIGPVHAEAERFAQFVELLLPCLAPCGIGGEFAGRDVDLLGDEIQRRLREDLARPEQAAGISEGAELQGIAEPVATPTPSRDGGQVRSSRVQ